jgi:type I restriction enzyme, S subunit
MPSIIEKITANNLESRTLAALRDVLLPKLLSGEVRLRNT